MNEQLSNTLAEALKASKDGIMNISLFAQQQAPDLVKEIIQWGFWNNILWSILSPAIVLSLFLVYKKVVKIFVNPENEWKDGVLFGCWAFFVIGGIMSIIFICQTFMSIEIVIKCLVAPKLYLMDYIKDFVTTKK